MARKFQTGDKVICDNEFYANQWSLVGKIGTVIGFVRRGVYQIDWNAAHHTPTMWHLSYLKSVEDPFVSWVKKVRRQAK